MQLIEARKPRPARENTNNEFLDDDVAVDNNVDDTIEREQSFMFFDFECTQDEGQHIPNLCVVQNESRD